MLRNMNFYNFMHKQILLIIALFAGTGFGYVIIGYLVLDSYKAELIWYMLVLGVSLWGYFLHREYKNHTLSVQEKEEWLHRVRYFLFIYFSTWIVIFVLYVLKEDVTMHYIAIATQLGVAVVSATFLVSQKRLSILILTTSMLPITIYLLRVQEYYSYLIAFYTVVLGWVLLYASRNTYNYLQKSQFQAYHDYLTKLGNRRYFVELLENALKIQKKDKTFLSLFLIDLDHFKTINDTLGHDIGDALLCEVAKRMDAISKKYGAIVSRLGGDEFCILGAMHQERDECLKNSISFAEELLVLIKEIYIVEGHHLYISASVGVSLVDNITADAGTFIKEADIAMYEAKSKGRDGVMLFNEELSLRIERKLEIERLLHFALLNKEIYLEYQPQIDRKENIIGCEVLVRWHNKKLGSISPAEFIPISEKTGLIIELGYFILKESFLTLREWDEKGFDLSQMSINISMRQFFHVNFIDTVEKMAKEYLNEKLCCKVIFEITETSVAEDMAMLISNMNRLKRLGIRFSMDDFGTGYSSLSYLRQIPIDELKIDQSFIKKVDSSAEDNTIINTIVNIAKNLKLSIVAEGVETLMQKDFLLNSDCDVLQGYYFSKPVNKEKFEEYIKSVKI